VVNIFLPSSVVAVVFQNSSGYLADFIKMKYLLIVELVGLLISMVGLCFLSSGFPVYLIIIINGIVGGIFGVSSVTWPRYFGIKNLVTIPDSVLAGLFSLIAAVILLFLAIKAVNF